MQLPPEPVDSLIDARYKGMESLSQLSLTIVAILSTGNLCCGGRESNQYSITKKRH